jgi:hypothetical protein
MRYTGVLYDFLGGTPLIDTTTMRCLAALGLTRAQQFEDGLWAFRASESDGSTKVSTAFEGQGSVVPSSVSDLPFSANLGGPSSGQMWATWTWLAFTVYRPGSGAFAVPALTTMFSRPAAPACAAVAGGAFGARNRSVRVGYMKDGKAYRVSNATPVVLLANQEIKITSPGAVAGYDGWCALVGNTAGTEHFLSDVPATALIAFGTDLTVTTDTFNKTPYDSSMDNGIVEIGLNANPAVYYWYPYYQFSDSLVYLFSGLASDTALSALEAVKDGRIPLAWRISGSSVKVSISANMPTATSTGTSTGGGRF